MHLCIPLVALAQQRREDVVLRCESRSLTATQLLSRVAALSHALSKGLKISRGSRIILASHNSDYLIQAQLSALDAGCIATPVNQRWSPEELASALSLTTPSAIFVDDNCLKLVESALNVLTQQASYPVIIRMGQSASPSTASPTGKAQVYHMEQLISNHLMSQPAKLQLLTAPRGEALICFTSGTTGKPKGVVLTHSNVHAQSIAKMNQVGYSRDDVYLHTSPMFHVGGISSAHAVLMAGAVQVVLPKFSAPETLNTIEKWGCTSFIAVPTMIQDMVQAVQQRQGRRSFPSVQRVLIGAGATDARMLAAVQQLFPSASVHSAYGMTEAASSITFRTLHSAPSRVQPARPAPPALQPINMAQLTAETVSAQADAPWATPQPRLPAQPLPVHNIPDMAGPGSCAGLPAAGVQIRVCPISDGASGELAELTSCAVGEVGEVLTRGPHVMLGYWNDPEETARVRDAEVLNADGWLRTGDLGYLDPQGRLWLMGRVKDMIKSGGENVYSSEVEAVLAVHPAVQEAVVMGLPHERLGEQVATVLVLRPGWQWQGYTLRAAGGSGLTSQAPTTQAQPAAKAQGSVSLADLQAWCREQGLSPFKFPRVALAHASPLPRNASGKVAKAEVQDKLLAHLRRGKKRMTAAQLRTSGQGSSVIPPGTMGRSKL